MGTALLLPAQDTAQALIQPVLGMPPETAHFRAHCAAYSSNLSLF